MKKVLYSTFFIIIMATSHFQSHCQMLAIKADDFSAVKNAFEFVSSAVVSGTKLQLTPPAMNRFGGAWWKSRIDLGSTKSFSSYFSFQITALSSDCADGIAFVLQTTSSGLGSKGQGIGYQGISPSIAVEFDTYKNSTDPDGNHIAIVENGQANSIHSAGTWVKSPYSIEGGYVLHVWIDYDGSKLEVRISNAATTRPDIATLSKKVNLNAMFGNSNVFVGLTSATGGFYATHEILRLLFSNTYFANGINPSALYTQAPSNVAVVSVPSTLPTGDNSIVSATVKYPDGTVASNISVNFITTGGGSFSNTIATTNAQGVATNTFNATTVGNFTITAIAAGGATNSTPLVLKAPALPLIPIAMAAKDIAESSFSANWNISSDATNYRIDVAKDNGFTTILTSYNNLQTGNVNNFAITGLAENTQYYYRVRAENKNGASSSSNIIGLYTLISGIAANPASNINVSSFTANWSISPGATSYRIDVAKDVSFTSILASYKNLQTGNVNKYEITGLAENTQYYYRVRAENKNGVSSNSNVINVFTTLSAIVATPATNITVSSFTANWNVTAGAINYRIDVAKDNGFTSILASYNNLQTGNVNNFAINGLAENTQYYYRVRAENKNGASSSSNIISLYTLISGIAANPATNVTVSSFTANWNISPGATSYRIDVAKDVSFTSILTSYKNLQTGNGNKYEITGLTENTQYYYRVRAENKNGVSSNSNVINVFTTLSAIVATPATNITVSSFTANWNLSPGATNYRIDVAKDNTFTSILPSYNNIQTGNVNNFAINGLTENTQYYYRVRAENKNGASSSSNIIGLYTLISGIAAIPASNITVSSFTANWNISPGATSYRIDVAKDVSFTSILTSYKNLQTGNGNKYEITGLTENTQYYYRLRAENKNGVSANSNIINVFTTLSAIVATPATNITVSSFTANWNLSPGATNYRIDVAKDNTFTSILPSYNNLQTGNVNNFAITGLTENTQYYYRVRAENKNGASSSSNIIGLYTLISGIAAIPASNITVSSFTANWNISPGATSYRIDVAKDVSFTSILTSYKNLQTGNVNKYEITGLAENTQYYYRVRAENKNGVSSNSNVINVFTTLSAIVATPATNITVSSFTANWNVTAGAINYRIDVAKDNGFTSILASYNNLQTGNVNNFAINGLTENTQYFYRVRAENSQGVSSNSNVINVYLVLSAIVATPASNVSVTSFIANWTTSSGATNYRIDVAKDVSFTNILTSYKNLQTGNVNKFEITGLTENTQYYYRVRAENKNGVSANSNIINVYTSLSAIVATPATNVSVSSFMANWNLSPGATNYRLDVAKDNGFTSILPSYNNLQIGKVNNYLITGLAENAQYFYRVRAENSQGVSPNSNVINVYLVLSAIVATPATNINVTSFTANWNNSPGATSYRIDVAKDVSFTNILTSYKNLQTGNGNKYEITGLAENTQYYYRVRAENKNGVSSNSNVINVFTTLSAIVATPATNITVSSFTANWNLSPGATNYRIDVAKDNAFTNIITSLQTGNVNNYQLTGLTENTQYFYRVRAENTHAVSSNSNVMNVYTFLSPIVATPASNINTSSFTANWNISSGATNYRIDVAKDNNFTSILAAYTNFQTGNVNKYEITGLTENIQYYYRVRAENPRGVSLNSNVITVYTVLSAVVATPATNINDTSFTANWSISTDATNYRIDVAKDNSFSNILPAYNNLQTGNVNKYVVKGLSENIQYYYRVRVEKIKTMSSNSNVINVSTVLSAIAATPATNIIDTSFTANWNLSPGATNYRIDVAKDNSFTNILATYNNLQTDNVSKYIITGLKENMQYYYRLRAENSFGISSSSNIIRVTTFLSPVVATSATSIIDTSFTANWNISTGAINYRIDVATDSNFVNILASYHNFQTGNVNNYLITGLIENTQYYYRVRAENTNCQSSDSKYISVYTRYSIVIATPATNVTDTSFIANWNKFSKAINFRIDVAKDNEFANILPSYNNLQTGNVNSYLITGLTENTKYYYRLRAEKIQYVSSNSNIMPTATIMPFEQDIHASKYVTPNGDNLNDTWKVGRIDVLKDYDLIIFNNTGEKLYQSKGYDNSWYAMYNGKPLPGGTYYYTFKKESSVFKGLINVIR